MIFNVATLFPEIIDSALNHSIIKRAIDNHIIKLNTFNYRDYTKNKHRKVDDTPYGGGAGMVLQYEPVYRTIEHIKKSNQTHVILLSPSGKKYTQSDSNRLKDYKNITILCGHYEGFDQRIVDNLIDEQISIGDFILTGGELPAMCIIDSVTRLLEGVLNPESIKEESFSEFLLEYPQYTKPESIDNLTVPSVLLSGNHANIKKWRIEKSIEITQKRRPELFQKYLKAKKEVDS